MRTISARLEDETGKVYTWTIRHTKDGWTLIDHESYERFYPGTWLDFVPHFHMVASNYGFKPLTQIS